MTSKVPCIVQEKSPLSKYFSETNCLEYLFSHMSNDEFKS